MDEKEKTCPVSSVGLVNECLTQFEEPEFSDTELIACMEVVEKKRGRGKSCSFCNPKQRRVDGNCSKFRSQRNKTKHKMVCEDI